MGIVEDSCSPAVWRTARPDLCEDSPCDFCCSAHEVLASGGICPVLSCEDALVSVGMDEIWPMGDNQDDAGNLELSAGSWLVSRGFGPFWLVSHHFGSI